MGRIVSEDYSGFKSNTGVDWGYYNKFEDILDKYMPVRGEGDSLASQVVTAVNKIIYKWYNDGDVFDNTHNMEGWANDLSDYANWLYAHVQKIRTVLLSIEDCYNDADYENLLKDLADTCFDEQFLKGLEDSPKDGSIYDCKGRFKFVEGQEDDEDEDYWDEDSDEEDEEYR